MSPTLLHVEPVQRYLSDVLLCSVPRRGKAAAMTFDDGPSPKNTPRLLDLLDDRNVKATFFLVGKRVKQFPDIAREIRDRGHEIGNHSHRHWPLPLLPNKLLRREVTQAEREIVAATGIRPVLFRPPMGWFSHRVLRILGDMGYQPVIGNIHPEDSRQPSADVIVNRVMKRLTPGSIIILHDGGWRTGVDRSQTIAAVSRILDGLEELRYRTMTVSELMGGNSPGAT